MRNVKWLAILIVSIFVIFLFLLTNAKINWKEFLVLFRILRTRVIKLIPPLPGGGGLSKKRSSVLSSKKRSSVFPLFIQRFKNNFHTLLQIYYPSLPPLFSQMKSPFLPMRSLHRGSEIRGRIISHMKHGSSTSKQIAFFYINCNIFVH